MVPLQRVQRPLGKPLLVEFETISKSTQPVTGISAQPVNSRLDRANSVRGRCDKPKRFRSYYLPVSTGSRHRRESWPLSTITNFETEIMTQLSLNTPLIIETPTGMTTSVHRTAYPMDRPPLTVQRGHAWHYTSVAALQNILQGQELWATSWRATNDRTEFRHGVDFLGQAWDAFGQEDEITDRTRDLLEEAGQISQYVDYFEHVNLLCAARERDSPYQWNSYAGGIEGIAIGLDLGFPMVTDVDNRPRRTNAELFGMQWLKVVYSATQKKMAAARFVRDMNAELLQEDSMDLHSFLALNILTALNFKHEGFRHEKETRCVSLSTGVNLRAMPNNADKTIVPWKGAPTYTSGRSQPLPIVEIMVGPLATEVTVQKVVQGLTDAGLGTVPVTRSSLPFR